ncbi:hypothetical protein HK096_008035, partial [Nowakowskiella sp. JEL0078]
TISNSLKTKLENHDLELFNSSLLENYSWRNDPSIPPSSEGVSKTFHAAHNRFNNAISSYQTALNISNAARIANFAQISKHRQTIESTPPKFPDSEIIRQLIYNQRTIEDSKLWRELDAEWTQHETVLFLTSFNQLKNVKSDLLLLDVLCDRFTYGIYIQSIEPVHFLMKRFRDRCIPSRNLEIENEIIDTHENSFTHLDTIYKLFAIALYHHQPPTPETYNYLITSGIYTKTDEGFRRSTITWKEMNSLGMLPMEETYLTLIAGYLSKNNIKSAKELLNFNPINLISRFVLNVLKMDSRLGNLKSATAALLDAVEIEEEIIKTGEFATDENGLIFMEGAEIFPNIVDSVADLLTEAVAEKSLILRIKASLQKSKDFGGFG